MRDIMFIFCFLSCIAEEPEVETLYTYDEGLELKAFTGKQARQYVEPIAHLTMSLFSEFPYLYKKNLKNEKEYLERYFSAATSRILLLFNKDSIVGFSSSISLTEESPEIQAPFIQKGYNLSEYFYIGDALLRAEHRNKNLMRVMAFYHTVRALKCKSNYLLFMTVDRPDHHPCRPLNYQSLDVMWRHYRFKKMPKMSVRERWEQIDTGNIEENSLSLWYRRIQKNPIPTSKI